MKHAMTDGRNRLQHHAAAMTVFAAVALLSPLEASATSALHSSASTSAVCSTRPPTSAASRPQPVWVALEDARQLARVNVRTGKVTQRLGVPGRPHNIVANKSGTVAAALWTERRIVVVRNNKVRPVKLGGAPHDVKMGGGRIVVANQGSHRLQLISLRGKRRGRILLRANPHDLAIAPSGRRAWVTLEGTDDMAYVSLKRRKVIRYKSTGKSPHDLLFARRPTLGHGLERRLSRLFTSGTSGEEQAPGRRGTPSRVHARWVAGVGHRSWGASCLRHIYEDIQGCKAHSNSGRTTPRHDHVGRKESGCCRPRSRATCCLSRCNSDAYTQGGCGCRPARRMGGAAQRTDGIGQYIWFLPDVVATTSRRIDSTKSRGPPAVSGRSVRHETRAL
jgi:hypothetical protein